MGIFKRERGASLIETMIAVGILGAIAYFVTGMIRNGTMGQRALQSSDDARTMTDNMAAILVDSIACANTFAKGVSIDPTLPDPSDSTRGTPISQIKDASGVNGNVVYQTNNKYSTKALLLESIYVGGPGTDAKSGITKWAPTGAGGTAFVQVTWAQANAAQNGGSPQKISKFFLINVTGLTSGKISACQAQAAGGSGSNLWTKTGIDIYNNNTGAVLVGTQNSVTNAAFDVFANGGHSLFVDTNGNVGFGTKSPSTLLEVVGSAAQPSTRAISSTLYSNLGYGGLFLGRAARGTELAPAPILKSDVVGSFSAQGYNGTSFAPPGVLSGMNVQATENWGGGSNGSSLIFLTTPNGTSSAVTRMEIDHNGNVGIGKSGAGYPLDVQGDVQATSFISTSDERLKTDIRPVEGLSKILALRGVRFRWIKDGVASIGLIAQEVEKVFPELVSTSITTGLKAVRYDALVGPLIEAVKELYGMCREALEISRENSRKISTLEARLSSSDAEIRLLLRQLEVQSKDLAALKTRLHSQ